MDDHVRALGIAFAEPARSWMGARPTLLDHLPVIGRSRRHPAVACAFGHQHFSLTLPATTGELLAADLCGERPASALAPVAMERFGG